MLVHRSGQQTGITPLHVDGRRRDASTPARVGGQRADRRGGRPGPGDTRLGRDAAPTAAAALFQNVPLAGGTPAAAFATLFDGDAPVQRHGRPDRRGHAAGDLRQPRVATAAFRRYAGTGDLNDAANWTAPVDIGYVDYPRLAGGPPGLFLLAGDESCGLFVRRWDGDDVRRAGVRSPPAATPARCTCFQDAGGRLHAVYPSIDVDGYHAEHAVSDDGVDLADRHARDADRRRADARCAWPPRPTTSASRSGSSARGDRDPGRRDRPGRAGRPPPPAPAPTPTPPPRPGAAVPQDGRRQADQRQGPRAAEGQQDVRRPRRDRRHPARRDDRRQAGADRARLGAVAHGARPRRCSSTTAWFQVAPAAAITEFTLNEPLASCKKRGARAAATKPKSRKLWGDGKGKFRTRGQYSAATIRGTRWLVQDSCAGTLTRVTQGSVLVRDNVKRKNIVLRKGKRYTARPRR